MHDTMESRIQAKSFPATAPGSEPRIPVAVRSILLAALEIGSQGVALFDPSDLLVYANEAFRNGWSVEPNTYPTFAEMMRLCHANGVGPVVETDNIESWIAAANRRRRFGPPLRAFEVDLCDGRWFWITERRLDSGWILLIGQDITSLKHTEETLRTARDTAVRDSLTDPLTQLANRRSAMNRLDWQFGGGKPFSLALIDLDHFKRINDSFGHAVGDEVLRLLGQKLEALRARNCMPARLAGDEFAVIGPPGADPDWFAELLRGFMQDAAQTTRFHDHLIQPQLSIGIARAGVDGKDVRSLLASADAALYEVKRGGRSAVSVYTKAMGDERLARAELRRELSDALANDEFVPFFQPIVDLGTGATVGYEMLARWKHPTHGLITPDRFIPLMMSSGGLMELTENLIERAGREIAGLPAGGRIAFNISVQQLKRDMLLPMLERLGEKGGIPLDRLEMEITEEALLENPLEAARAVEAVRKLGLRIVLDDFGIGFSSLHHLREMHFDGVKLDRSFLKKLDERRNQRFLAALIHLANELNLETVVEGIEDEKTRDIVAGLGARFGQGYLFGRPAPAQTPV
ncbi:MAG: hypothetical protein DI629_05000 [Mesorhizobium amorphae]|nr:MAG: hypothetical protein DI629_05000 [Mesorhizobium amorphae]